MKKKQLMTDHLLINDLGQRYPKRTSCSGLFRIVQAVSEGTNISLYFLDLMSRGTADGFHKCSRDWMSGQDVLRRQRVARWVITKTRGLSLSSLSIAVQVYCYARACFKHKTQKSLNLENR